jgi:hypothetical protein
MAAERDLWVLHYMDVLTSRLGWKAETDEDGDIRVVLTNGTILHVINCADDPAYLRVVGSWKASDHASAADLAQAASEVAEKVKLVKIRPLRQGVQVATEMLLAAPSCLPDKRLVADVLPRCADVITYAASEFLTAVEFHGIEGANEFGPEDVLQEPGSSTA